MALIGDLVLRAGNMSAALWLLVAGIAVAALAKVFWRPRMPTNSPSWWKCDDWPILGALRFYRERVDFLSNAARHTPGQHFSFYIGQKQVVAMAGTEGRKTFFESRDLHFGDGYAALLTGTPSAPNQKAQTRDFDSWFSKTLVNLIKKDQFVKNLDALTGDTRDMFDSLADAQPSHANAKWRVMDPFHHLYRTVYKLTMRTVGAEDIADDQKLLDATLAHFESFERRSSVARVVFPWLPTPNHVLRMYEGARLAFVFQRIIEDRKATGKKRMDALQYLMDQGNDLHDILAFVIGALFAGLLNSGINAAWIPVFLTQNKEWMERLRTEVDGVVAKKRSSPEQSPADVLDTLTVDDWEAEFPVADLCLRESIRFAMPGAAFRKNKSGHDIEIGSTGQVIPNGAFATYCLDDVHFDENIYTDMWRFDPGRYLEDRAEDKKKPHAYVGWGSGRHPCLGMRFAKLENTLLLAYFVAMYDFELSDEWGHRETRPAPLPSRSFNAAQKPAEKVYLRYKPRSTSTTTEKS